MGLLKRKTQAPKEKSTLYVW